MRKPKDISGERYGRLVAIRLAFDFEKKKKSKNTSAQWYCECDCGNSSIVSKHALNRKSSTSCGCLRTENSRISLKNKRPKGIISALKRKFTAYKFNAKKKGRSFELTMEYFHELITSNCDYCGTEPNQLTCIYRSKDEENTLIHNGIDRIDSCA